MPKRLPTLPLLKIDMDYHITSSAQCAEQRPDTESRPQKRFFRPRIKNLAALAAFVLGAAFIALGVMRGEQRIVLQKAIRICLECIGIG